MIGSADRSSTSTSTSNSDLVPLPDRLRFPGVVVPALVDGGTWATPPIFSIICPARPLFFFWLNTTAPGGSEFVLDHVALPKSRYGRGRGVSTKIALKVVPFLGGVGPSTSPSISPSCSRLSSGRRRALAALPPLDQTVLVEALCDRFRNRLFLSGRNAAPSISTSSPRSRFLAFVNGESVFEGDSVGVVVVVERGVTRNGLSSSSVMIVPTEGGGCKNSSFGTGGLEGEADANGIEKDAETGSRLGENGFTFAAAGSGSRSRSCTIGLVRLIIEVGSAGFGCWSVVGG
jgi:hypothetical protein